MRTRLPSLTALRTFEAAARHLSFTSAASELGVTQAAVSHQVKLLECSLGLLLFERSARALRLTQEGEFLAEIASKAFDRLTHAIEEMKAARRQQFILTVAVTPTFAQLWLAPRLHRFWSRSPEVELRIHHSVGSVDVIGDADIAVRLGRGKWHGLQAEPLVPPSFAPYCSPTLINGPLPLRTLDDLRHHTLLHAHDHSLWTEWLRAAAIDNCDGERGPILDDPLVLEYAAVEGRGVALCPMALLGDYLSDGRLVRPFEVNPQTEFAYYVVYAPGALKKHKVRTFRDFLLEEAEGESGSTPFHDTIASASSDCPLAN